MRRAHFGDKPQERAISLGLDFAEELGGLTAVELQAVAKELGECGEDPQEYVWLGRVLCDLSEIVNRLLRKTNIGPKDLLNYLE